MIGAAWRRQKVTMRTPQQRGLKFRNDRCCLETTESHNENTSAKRIETGGQMSMDWLQRRCNKNTSAKKIETDEAKEKFWEAINVTIRTPQ